MTTIIHTFAPDEWQDFWAALDPTTHAWWFKVEDGTNELQFVVFSSENIASDAINKNRPGRMPIRISYSDAVRLAILAGATKIAEYDEDLHMVAHIPLAYIKKERLI